MESIDYTVYCPDVRVVKQSDTKVKSEIEAAEQKMSLFLPAKKGRISNRIGVSTFCVEDAPHADVVSIYI
jgi:hypothetical protein